MATREQIRAAMHRQPFVGFTVNLGGGQKFYVRHPDFISIPTTDRGRDVVIHDDDGMHLVDILHIVEMSVPEAASPAGSPAAAHSMSPEI
jgi:hypothetical protein